MSGISASLRSNDTAVGAMLIAPAFSEGLLSCAATNQI
jgi:hypothetical protein